MANVRPQMGRRKTRPGFRWKAVTVPGPRPGTSITQHVEVPIDTLEPTQPTQVPDPQQDVTTVIKEYADETPNTRTTTIKGGLLGGPMEDWAGRGAERDERGMQDWYANMAQAQARVDQGTAAPSQQEVEGALQRYGDVRRSQLTTPDLSPIPGAVHAGMPGVQQPPVDPRFQRWPAGQVPRMADPNQLPAGAAGRNRPPEYYQHPAVQQQLAAEKRAEEMKRRGWIQNRFHPDMRGLPQMPAPNDERAEILKARKQKFLEREAQELAARQKMREQTGGAAPTQAQIEESLGRYGDFRRKQLTRPTMPDAGAVHEGMPGIPQPSRPVATGSSIADARMAAIADANRIEAEAERMPRPGAVHEDMPGVRQPTPDPRFQPFLPGQDMGMDDPTWSRATAVNVPAPDPRRVAEHVAKQEAQGRLAAATLPSDFGQDDPSDFEGWDPEDLDRYIEARKKRLQGQESPYPSMAIDQESLEGTIYGKPSTGQKVAAEILGLAPDLYRRYINSLLMLLGAEEDDDILIETDPTEWILKKFQENPHMIRRSKDYILKAIKGGVDTVEAGGKGVAKIAGETVDHWVGELDKTAKEIGADDKASIVPKLVADAKDYWKPKTIEMGRKYDAWLKRKEEGAAAIERGPDDPALLYDDPRRRFEGYPKQIGMPVTGPPAPTVPKTVADKKAVDERVAAAGTDVVTSKIDNNNELKNNPQLAALWGKYAYDPAARKKAYLDNLKQVYKKALMLDIIASLTGGKSRSKEYLKMATNKLDAIDQFDQEQRVSNIWKQVFTGTDGQFYMPKNKREAAERAHFFGGDPKTVSSIFGSVPEERKIQYYRKDPNKTNEWEIIRSDVDPGPSYIAGQPRSKTPSGDELLADRKMKRYNDLLATYDSATGEDKVVALRNLENWASFAKLKTGGITEQQNRAFARDLWKLYFTEDESLMPGAPTWREYYYGTGQFVLPKDDTGRKVGGWGAPGGGQTTGGETKELKSFNSEAEAEAAIKAGKVEKGEVIIIAGRRAEA